MNGALLVNKHAGISSFGIIEVLKEQLIHDMGVPRKQLPKMGHGGTLDPFATGLMMILVGPSVKLARYFLGASKTYHGTMKFGETTIPGDPTAPVSETCQNLPNSLELLQDIAHRLTLQPYFQIPPMHSAKKKNGRPLYELARAGLEVEREPKLCHLYEFEILNYSAPMAEFRVKCGSGTYVRTLAQDFARMAGSLALLQNLERLGSGPFRVENALSIPEIRAAGKEGRTWNKLSCWIPFDQLLDGYSSAEVTADEKEQLYKGKQSVLFNISRRIQLRDSSFDDSCFVLYHAKRLVGVVRKDETGTGWCIERLFT